MDIKVLQLHKRASYEFKHIQDKYALDSDTKIFALADGTTQSFNSEIWAEIITKEFVSNPTFNTKDLIYFFKNQVAKYKNANFEFSSNPAKASLEKAKQNKGGTSTFMGLQFKSENKVELISCGDTNLFIINSENKVIGYPFSNVDSLDENNYFINTEQLIQNNIDDTFFKKMSFELNSNDTIIIATDALSRLIFKNPSTLSEILKIENFSQLHQFCLHYWEGKELQEDDISAIIIPFQNTGTAKIIQPPNDFSFPKEIEKIFIPTPPPTNPNYTDMEINEIREQFNFISHDFQQVKKKLNFHEKILIISTCILAANIFLVSILLLTNSNGESNGNSQSVIEKKYQSIIKDLKNQIQKLTSKNGDDVTQEKSPEESSNSLSKKDAIERQQELKNAGYKIKQDSIWGVNSEKTWIEYKNKKENGK
jgi:hypothetical protein